MVLFGRLEFPIVILLQVRGKTKYLGCKAIVCRPDAISSNYEAME